MNCPLCNHCVSNKFEKNKKNYWICEKCFLVFLDPSFRLSHDEEKERYKLHENFIENPGYKDFLLKIAKPCFKYLNKNSLCLDYGSGNSKSLEFIFNENGFNMESYDPFFVKTEFKTYDLIVCNEVIEHFYNPMKEFLKIKNLLNKKGKLAIGTFFWDDKTDLKNFWYINDPTHVSIFNEKTISCLSNCLSMKTIEKVDDRIFILEKNN